MINNYFKIAFRNLRKQPLYSAINILGLSVGIACCMLIVIYLQYEYSFDSFHIQKEQIFRLNKVVTPTTGGTEYHAITSGPMGPQLKADFPEVKDFVRVLPWFDDVLLSREQKNLIVDRFVLADSTFFKVFDFKMLKGDPSTALPRPLTAVISREVADHFFGDDNPVGQTITGLSDLNYTITGVVENAPENSHLQYDILVSWSSTSPSALDMGWLNSWFPQAIYTYLVLDENHDRANLEEKLGEFMRQHFSQRAEQYELYLQPFTEIYLHSTHILYDETLKSGSITNVYIFSAVAILVLLIACINFMNLSTARSLDRAREVGVRKVLGASKNQLGWQFLGESLILSFTAMLVSLGLIEAGIPVLEQLGVSIEPMWIARIDIQSALIGITFLTGLISGTYPAFVLTDFKPVQVLYGRVDKSGAGDAFLRKTLVTVQFTLSIILIIGTLVIYRQMQFVSEKNLGFQKEQVLVLQLGGTDIIKQSDTFKEELLRHSNIRQVTSTNSVPGSGFMSLDIKPEGKATDESWVTNIIRLGDDNFLETYGMSLAAGRFFSKEFATDSSMIVINQALAKSLGWDDPIGKRIDIPGEISDGQVIGVVKDFHTTSLHNAVEPLLFYQKDNGSFLSLRVEPSGINKTLNYIEETWQKFDPLYPVDYYFLDDHFEAFYAAEQRTLRVLLIFTGLAIFVACMGLFGLSVFMINRRKKELGIRKILGSSVVQIVKLVSRDFLILVGIGFVIAVPVAWWLAAKWLQEFAYRINLGAGTFLLAGVTALLLALCVVLWQSIKVALMNPVESLKSE